jgi:hypothetical protein
MWVDAKARGVPFSHEHVLVMTPYNAQVAALFEPECRSPQQMKPANAFSGYREMVAGV